MDSEGLCKVHFCETDFWTSEMQRWYNGREPLKLQALGKERGGENETPAGAEWLVK